MHMDFEQALTKFTEQINKETKAHSEKRYPDTLKYADDDSEYFGPVKIQRGQKNIKIITGGKNTTSVYCFVEIATGNILKAASYKAPAKGDRGNIFKPETYVNKGLDNASWLYR